MKNTLKIMAALATLLSSTTQAETSVTLYGILDAGVGYSKVDGTIVDPVTNQRVSLDRSRFGMTDSVKNGSRWGIRGKEDLGGGLYAKFQLESGFNLSNGQSTQGGRLFGRNATVGLGSDNWGQFNLGNV
jgi:GBP family porin